MIKSQALVVRYQAASCKRVKWPVRLVIALCIALGICCHTFTFYIAAMGAPPMLTFPLTIVLGVIILGSGIAVVVQQNYGVSWSAPLRTVLLVSLLSFAIADLTIPICHWPMRVAFAVQHRRIEELAARVEHGYVPNTPVCLGFYTVTRAEVNGDGVVCLWLNQHGEPPYAFGRCKASEVQKNFPGLIQQVTLSDDWQFIDQWD